MGGKPKPTALKILHGNPGHRPLNKHEPQPEAVIPSCPSHLDAIAKKEWQRVVPELFSLGLLTGVDRAALAGYCQLYSRWVTAEKDLQKRGYVIENLGANAHIHPQMVNPFVRISEIALTQMRHFMGEFGLTPSSRTRVVVTNVGDAKKKEKARKLAEKYF